MQASLGKDAVALAEQDPPRPAGGRHRPARRRRTGRLPGDPRPRRRIPGPLSDRAGRDGRPARRLQRRWRRLPDQAVRVRRADRSAQRAAAPRGRPEARGRGGRSAAGSRGHAVVCRRNHDRAHPDGVPASRRARRQTRRDRATARVDRDAAGRDGAIVHDNTLDVYLGRLRQKLAELPTAAR